MDTAISGSSTFLGRAVAKYDIDELEQLAKSGNEVRPKRQDYVEVRRCDGTIAKARGERTFYGAFTGGFSAGYWNTVGSKEGFAPAPFVSSRSKRPGEKRKQAEDYMDEEDLREHRSSHRTITPNGVFAPRKDPHSETKGFPALPIELEEDIFPKLAEKSLGARMLTAASSVGVGSEQPAKVRKKYGCSLPPELSQATHTSSSSDALVRDSMLQATPECIEVEDAKAIELVFRPRFSRSSAATESRELEASLQRLWRAKTDMHGVGHDEGYVGSSTVVAAELKDTRRLYMSSNKNQLLGSSKGYGDFHTGVLDMDDQDAWEDCYEADREAYDFALGDAEEEPQVPAIEDPRCQGSAKRHKGQPPGFTAGQQLEEPKLSFREWRAPTVPRGYRGMHAHVGDFAAEARAGSREHGVLLEFLVKHGFSRLMQPSSRAELLGEKSRIASAAPAPAAPKSEPTPEAAIAEAGTLWKGPSAEQKEALLRSLGRSFVSGQSQDMDGGAGRHEPFKSEPGKQKRYVQFCLAIDGKASASEAMKDTGGLGEASRVNELAEFGRVYRMFKQENPTVDIQCALSAKQESSLAPVLRRRVHAWRPERLLCKRWGVPEPSVQLQKEMLGFSEVQLGLIKESEASAEKAKSLTPPVMSPPEPQKGDLPRPPASLFAAIFGDSDDDA